MKRTNNYWQKRIQNQQLNLWDIGFDAIDKELRTQYKRAYIETLQDMSDLWDKLVSESADGSVKVNDLYRMNRYYEIQNRLNARLSSLGLREDTAFANALMRLYQDAFSSLDEYISELTNSPMHSGSFTLEQRYAAEKVIKSVWCADGKNWSQRIWEHKANLQQKVEDGLIDCVSRGVSKDVLVSTLLHDFNVGFNDADRIARTELTYVQNQACKQRYEEAGVKLYKFLAEIDSRTSDVCKEHNGKVYAFTVAAVGENYPPLHPNCRSTVIPVLDKEVSNDNN